MCTKMQSSCGQHNTYELPQLQIYEGTMHGNAQEKHDIRLHHHLAENLLPSQQH
jgi:hypothetical protein